MRIVPTLLFAVLAACGCGRPAADPPAPERPPTAPGSTTTCARDHPRSAPRPLPTSVARDLLETAVSRATARSRTFRTDLDVRIGALRFAGTLRGIRHEAGASDARLAWNGDARLLPAGRVRIAADRLSFRPNGSRDRVELGSASGVALDVGRELLAHPFLLEASAANGSRARFDVTLFAPPARLRDYATRERQGPVTELLRDARSLEIVVHVADGELVADRFRLDARVPALEQLPAFLHGRHLSITGTTGAVRTCVET